MAAQTSFFRGRSSISINRGPVAVLRRGLRADAEDHECSRTPRYRPCAGRITRRASTQLWERALAKSPDDRYQAADEMAGDLNSIVEELRHEQMVELLPRAQGLLEAQDLTRAPCRWWQQALKVDGKNTGAKELRSEIRRRLGRRQRDEKLAELLDLAEEALSNDDFDRSLSLVSEGLLIDPSSGSFLELQEKVQREKQKLQQS